MRTMILMLPVIWVSLVAAQVTATAATTAVAASELATHHTRLLLDPENTPPPDLNGAVIAAHFDFESSDNAWTKVPTDFMGLSSSYQGLFTFMDSSVFRQMMKNLFAYGKKDSIAFRSMGVTQTPKKAQWAILSNHTADFPIKYILQIPLYINNKPNISVKKDYPGVKIVRDSVAAVGAHRVLSYTAGNEPDWFSNNRGWDSNKYMDEGGYFDRDWALVETMIAPEIKAHFNGSCRMLAGPNTANLWIWNTSRTADWMRDHNCIKTLTNHYYALGPYKVPTDLKINTDYTDLLSNDAVDNAYWMSIGFGTVAHAAGGTFRVTEMGSIYSGGVWGISDRIAATMWTLDVSLNFAYFKTDGIHFNGNGCTSYSPINYGWCSKQNESGGDTEISGMRANGPYYGMLMFQRAVATGAYVFPIKPQLADQWLPARIWGMKPTDPKENWRNVLVINRGWWSGAAGIANVTLVGKYKQGTVCRLGAGAQVPWNKRVYAPASKIYMCGQQVGLDGNLVGNFYLETPKMSAVRLSSGQWETTFSIWTDPVNAVLLETEILPP